MLGGRSRRSGRQGRLRRSPAESMLEGRSHVQRRRSTNRRSRRAKRRANPRPRRAPGKKTKHQAWVAKKNAVLTRYKKLRSEDLPIASGVIEGAVRNLVGVRLEAPGHALGARPRRGHPPSTLRAPQWAVGCLRELPRQPLRFPTSRAARPHSNSRCQTYYEEGGVRARYKTGICTQHTSVRTTCRRTYCRRTVATWQRGQPSVLFMSS